MSRRRAVSGATRPPNGRGPGVAGQRHRGPWLTLSCELLHAMQTRIHKSVISLNLSDKRKPHAAVGEGDGDTRVDNCQSGQVAVAGVDLLHAGQEVNRGFGLIQRSARAHLAYSARPPPRHNCVRVRRASGPRLACCKGHSSADPPGVRQFRSRPGGPAGAGGPSGTSAGRSPNPSDGVAIGPGGCTGGCFRRIVPATTRRVNSP